MTEHNNLKLDKDKLKEAFDLSSFDVNAVIRGAQLTLVGGASLVFPLPCFSPRCLHGPYQGDDEIDRLRMLRLT